MPYVWDLPNLNLRLHAVEVCIPASTQDLDRPESLAKAPYSVGVLKRGATSQKRCVVMSQHLQRTQEKLYEVVLRTEIEAFQK